MNRYILLSFLFMGWTFYELSGGADFEPPSAKQVAITEPIDEPKVQTERSVAEFTAPEPVAKPEPVVLPEASAQLDRVAEPEPSNVAAGLVVAEIDTEIPAPTGIVISADWSTDLESQTVTTPAGNDFSFDVEPFRKHNMINGLDDIGLTLMHEDKITTFESNQKQSMPWLWREA